MNVPDRSFLLVPIAELDARMTERIRTIRNESSVRRWMFTHHEITAEEHRDWLERTRIDDRLVIRAVVDADGTVVGTVGLNPFDRRNRIGFIGIYLTESVRGGLGTAVLTRFLKHCFETLPIDRVVAEILEDNLAGRRVHEKAGFTWVGWSHRTVMRGDTSDRVMRWELIRTATTSRGLQPDVSTPTAGG